MPCPKAQIESGRFSTPSNLLKEDVELVDVHEDEFLAGDLDGALVCNLDVY